MEGGREVLRGKEILRKGSGLEKWDTWRENSAMRVTRR
jgi:hypothetical protein